MRGYLGRCGYRGALWLGACKALDIAVSDLDLEVLGDAGLAVNVLTLFKEDAAGAQLLGEADRAAEHLTVKNLLPLTFVKVQELAQRVSVRLGLTDSAGVQLSRLLLFAAAAGDFQRRLQTQEV